MLFQCRDFWSGVEQMSGQVTQKEVIRLLFTHQLLNDLPTMLRVKSTLLHGARCFITAEWCTVLSMFDWKQCIRKFIRKIDSYCTLKYTTIHPIAPEMRSVIMPYNQMPKAEHTLAEMLNLIATYQSDRHPFKYVLMHTTRPSTAGSLNLYQHTLYCLS